MKQFVHDHSLSLAVGALTILAMGAREAVAWHGWDDSSGFLQSQVVIMGESWAEIGQFLIAVLFTKWFVERGSAESKE